MLQQAPSLFPAVSATLCLLVYKDNPGALDSSTAFLDMPKSSRDCYVGPRLQPDSACFN
jgi:hypothetical protein